ncbi:MAG: nitroreductase family deazaflavin-dependent oxidoreductase [Acidimicrobiales bacterium]
MQLGSWDFKEKPAGVWKAVLKAPSYLYRWHLGFLLGKRFLMIEHIGRKSEATYYTTVEVVDQATGTREFFVCSGTGPDADWYLNLKATPAAAVQVGRHRWVPRQRMLENKEASERFASYEQRHPKAARRLLKSMGNTYDGTDAGRTDMMSEMPMVAFSDH